MENNYGRYGSLKARKGKQHALAAILRQASALLRNTNSGCLVYSVGKRTEEPDTVYVYEVWTSREAHAASLRNDDVRQLIANARPLLDEPPKKGIEFHIVTAD